MMDLEKIRKEIDATDDKIIELLSRRAKLVEEVVKVKKERSQIRDERRISQVISKARQRAKKHGLDPDFAERIYTEIIEYFISFEMKKFEER